MIHSKQLSKSFKNPIKEPGVLGTLKSFVKQDYRLISAVSDFSADIQPGEFVGLLGPNGAGKTTLMKMFTGIIQPGSGELNVLGYYPFDRKKEFRRRIALVMGQKSQLWWDIPAMDSFALLQAYYEIEKSAFQKRLHELAEILGVQELLQTHIRKLSLGERMKMELMACLLHEPEVIFLDEPTIGLDVVAQRSIREFLREYQKRSGSTIILTSHYMADVDALCSRIILILAGRKRFDGSIDSFSGILGQEKFVAISFSAPVQSDSRVFQGLHAVWNEDHTEVELRIAEAELRERTVAILSDFPVIDFTTEKMPIERVMETLLTRPELMDGAKA